jgi:hypothetical protein
MGQAAFPVISLSLSLLMTESKTYVSTYSGEPTKDRFVRLPLKKIVEAKTFDIGDALWSADQEISILAKTDFLKKMKKQQPELLASWATYFGMTVQKLLATKEIPLWMCDACMLGVEYNNPDRLMTYLNMKDPGVKERIAKLNAAYANQVKSMVDSADRVSLTELKYQSVLVIPHKDRDSSQWNRMEAGKGLLISADELGAKQWLRDHVLGVEHRNLDQLCLHIRSEYEHLSPDKFAALIIGRAADARAARVRHNEQEELVRTRRLKIYSLSISERQKRTNAEAQDVSKRQKLQ